MSKKTRLTLDLDPELHARLKAVAAEKGLTLEELCLIALKHRAEFGKAVGPDPVLEELWDNEQDAVFDDL